MIDPDKQACLDEPHIIQHDTPGCPGARIPDLLEAAEMLAQVAEHASWKRWPHGHRARLVGLAQVALLAWKAASWTRPGPAQ